MKSENLEAGNRTMRPGVTVLLLLSFGALLLLIGILGAGTLRRTQEIFDQTIIAQQAYEEVDQALRDLPADIHLAGILVRDYALDPSPLAAPVYKELLAKEQRKIEQYIARLSLLHSVQREKVERLQKEIQAYADTLDPVLRWSPQEKVARSFEVIRETLIPRRQAIVDLARELSTLNAQNLALQRQASDRGRRDLQRFVRNLAVACLGLGVAVAAVSTRRALNLERRSRAERERAVEAEREQRRLAMRVVQVQEEERKRIALELHDAVGQMASALGLELGRLENLRQSVDQFHEKILEVKQMNADVIRALKDLAAGLRPAMLDQLGLGPALRSHAREFERRTSISTEVRLEGDLDVVPEPHRTCIYRIVQEALNNCSRHAKARNVIISLYGSPLLVSLAVQDDGVGFDVAEKSKTGLGLLGIAERVRDLNGECRIDSRAGIGTLLTVELPVREREAA